MTQCGWENCPPDVRESVQTFVQWMRDIFGGDLTGVYLHGSLAMGCFNPNRSDIDLLVVVRQPVSDDQKRALVRRLLSHSGEPYPYEISLLKESNLFPWRYPPLFEFHYSEDWRIRFEEAIHKGKIPDMGSTTDLDLAAHIAVLKARGLCLYGQAIEYTFPNVPRSHFMDAIFRDIREARQNLIYDPVSVILNICRTHCYLVENHICSKDEGAEWALERMKPIYRPLVAHLLRYYRGEEDIIPFDLIDIAQCVAYLDAKLTALFIEQENQK